MKILILGSKGFIGSSLCKYFKSKKLKFKTDFGRKKLNLLSLENFQILIGNSKPDVVVNCLGVVGGIQWGLNNKVKIFEENNLLTLNLLKSIKNKKITLINLLANCIYPHHFKKFFEKNIFDGPVHDSVFEYGLSRRMLFSASKAYADEELLNFINLIPSNVYGPNDHFNPIRSHALGGLIAKFHKASISELKEVEIWGSGKPKRDWIYIEDLCKVIYKTILLNKKLSNVTFNVASGNCISIRYLAKTIAKKYNYQGMIIYNKNYTDGDPIKSFDIKLLNKYLNFKNFTDIDTGLEKTIYYLRKNENKISMRLL